MLLVPVLLVGTSAPSSPLPVALSVANLRVDSLAERDALGIDTARPSFSWIPELVNCTESNDDCSMVPENRGLIQREYRVVLLHAGDVAWDSGRVLSAETVHVRPPVGAVSLLPAARYRWSVEVWVASRAGEVLTAESNAASFITGCGEATLGSRGPWRGASWLKGFGARRNGTEPEAAGLANVFAAPVTLPVGWAPSTARPPVLFAAAAGYVELYCNGRQLHADRMLEPGWSNWAKRAYYITADLSGCLGPGNNTIGVMLGNGWWAKPNHVRATAGSIASRDGRTRFAARDPPQFVLRTANLPARLVSCVDCAAGWRAAPGPLLFDSIWDGETYDARRELEFEDAVTAANTANTANAAAATATWAAPLLGTALPPSVVLSPAAFPPIRLGPEHSPRGLREHAPGVWIADFGQNMAAVVRLRIRPGLPAGTRVQLRHAEVLLHEPYCGGPRASWRDAGHVAKCDGGLYVANLRSARATDVYFTSGRPGGETFRPRFTQHGFRYVEVAGLGYRPSAADIIAVEVHSDVPRAGGIRFEGEPLLNAIQHNIAWGAQSNLMSVPTDCPQRDERYGWMGDASIGAEINFYNLEAPSLAAFYAAWLTLVQDDQDPAGFVHNLTPDCEDGCEEAEAGGGMKGPGAAAWQGAYPTLVWASYRYTGDRELVQAHWPSLQRYMAWFGSHYPGARFNGTAPGIPTIGDWCPPPQGDCAPAAWCPEPGKYMGGFTCPVVYANSTLTSLGSYLHDLTTMTELAAAINEHASAAAYTQQKQALGADLTRVFLGGAAGAVRYGEGWQTEQGLPLWLGIVPADAAARVLDHLVTNILVTNHGHTNSGILGMKYVLEALAQHGRTDVALQMLLQTTYPSIGFQIAGGHNETPATTLWELWDAWTEDPSMASRNHIMFGSPSQFFFKALAGIRTVRGQPGFQHVLIAPPSPRTLLVAAGSNLTGVAANVSSVRGPVAVAWAVRRSPGRTGGAGGAVDTVFELNVTVPLGSNGSVAVPLARPGDGARCSVSERGSPIFGGGQFIPPPGQPGGGVYGATIRSAVADVPGPAIVFEVGSGSFAFAMQCYGAGCTC